MRKLFILLITAVFCLLPVSDARGDDVVQKGRLNVDGAITQESFLVSGGKVYVPVKSVVCHTGIQLKWDSKTGTLVFTYTDLSSIRAYTKTDTINERDNYSKADFLLSGGKTYISVSDLHRVTRRNVFWDGGNHVLYVYTYAYPVQGHSIISSLPYEGLDIENNCLFFSLDGLPQASWEMEGELKDLRLISKTAQAGMEEIQIAAFYLQPDGNLSQLIITQRKLPSGDRIFFTRAHSPLAQQVLSLNMQSTPNIFGSGAIHFIDKGVLKEFLYQEPFSFEQRLIITKGTSIDLWHILSLEDLTIKNLLVKRAWNASLDYHKSNVWVTPEGTYRSTPVEYLNKAQLQNQNVNLQASSPMLLLDVLNVQTSRLLEDLVHSAKFTLVKLRGKDGFWRSGINVAYLNRAYSLGPNYIDTRMSVDASLFLVRYGLMFGDSDALNKGAHFKQYFSSLKGKKVTYNLQGGIFYPDYYSEIQKKKTLVSLNHALYEMNYLYTLYNELGDHEAKGMADEIRKFIDNSAKRWIAPSGDLYYALSPEGKYYAEDYVNITYVDLFVAKSILEYMEESCSAVEDLLLRKEGYLSSVNAPQFESNLQVNAVLEKFDVQSSRKGDFFFPYPLKVQMAEAGNQAYFACGTYHWIKGAQSITYLGKTYELDPMKKYLVILTKGGLTVSGQEGNVPLSDTER